MAAVVIAVGVAGCSSPAPMAKAPIKARGHVPRQTSTSENALARWWSALSKSNPSPAGRNKTQGAATSVPVVAVDVSDVAARHPAWKLANALEASQARPIRFDPISSKDASEIRIGSPSFDVNFNTPSTPSDGNDGSADPTASTPEEFFPDAPNAAGPEVMASGLDELEANAEQDQRESITAFLQLTTQRRSDWAENYEAILKTALNEDVTAMQRTSLPPVSPLLPSADDQLEMTNLRLQLSRNIFATDQELEAARARLSELLLKWRQQLSAQQQERLKELQRLRIEEPAAEKSKGLQRIARDLEAIRAAQQSAQIAIAEEHRARVDQDFGSEQARLGIVLPAAGALGPTSNPGTLEARNTPSKNIPSGSTASRSPLAALGLQEDLVFIRTNPVRASSIPGRAGLPAAQTGANLNAKDARIQALRRLAWQESIKQIQMASRRAGWQWRTTAQSKASEKRSGIVIPDRTPEILQMIFG